MSSTSWVSGNTAPAPDAVPLYGPDFAADPHAVYAQLREEHGPIAPVELAPGVRASLVLSMAVAREVLLDSDTYSKDPRPWQAGLSRDAAAEQVLPLLGYRDNCLFADGAEHRRLRGAVTDALDRTDLHELSDHVRATARRLITGFVHRGDADLLHDYAKLLALDAFNLLFGCPPDLGATLSTAMREMFDNIDPGNADLRLVQCLRELVALRRRTPGKDVLSRMIRHPAGLDDGELVNHLVVLVGAGNEPQKNLIANTLRLLLIDPEFGNALTIGTTAISDALQRSVAQDPPMSNFGVHYPVRDVIVRCFLLPAHRPVVISYAAADTDPDLGTDIDWTGSRAHLAWSAGPHECPARGPAFTIATAAIETVLEMLPELRLAVAADHLVWRAGPFHRALEHLPVTFTPQSYSPASRT